MWHEHTGSTADAAGGSPVSGSNEAWPAGYRLRLRGHLDDHWSSRFAGFALVRNPDGTTTLSGPVADQAELHGMLARIRDLGVTLLTVEALGPDHDRET